VDRALLVHRPIPRAQMHHAQNQMSFRPRLCSWAELAQRLDAGVSSEQRASGGAADVAQNARGQLSRCCESRSSTCLAAKGALRWAGQSWGGGRERRGGDVAMG